MMNLAAIASVLQQTGTFNGEIKGVCTDTRQILPGHLFVAIVGERFDGHDFVAEAAAKGAVAAVVTRRVADVTIPQLVVADTLAALATLAKEHRAHLHCPVIALTGSNGKTSVKEMISAILPQPSHATKGNFNNHIGAPLSILQLTAEHRYAVFELGANHVGEIAYTAAIAKPDVALINNIAPAHVECFGSIEGVARAKGEIYQSLGSKGTAIVNDDDAYAHFWDELIHDKKIVRFSVTHPADVYAQDISFDELGQGQFTLVLPNGRLTIHLQVPGLHNVRNAVAAAACCFAVGINHEDIQRGLTSFAGVKGRLTRLMGKNKAVIIDDTYNANLRSVISGLEVLAKHPGKKILVFGDMGELGQWSAQHHQEVGEVAKQLGINKVLSCGTQSRLAAQAFGKDGQHFSSQEELVHSLLAELAPETTVLVKGSRSSAMENIVHQLVAV